jgi:hypothetical protein
MEEAFKKIIPEVQFVVEIRVAESWKAALPARAVVWNEQL